MSKGTFSHLKALFCFFVVVFCVCVFFCFFFVFCFFKLQSSLRLLVPDEVLFSFI